MVQAESPNYGHDDMITKECFMAAIAVFGTLIPRETSSTGFVTAFLPTAAR